MYSLRDRLQRPVPMAVAMVLCVATTTAAAPVEIDAGGLIHRGPYLMCGDQEAMIHLLYEGRPLIHDAGVFCGINGYTRPRDLQNKTLTRQADRFIITGDVADSGVSFSMTVRPDGDRVRITITRTGTWPDDTWGGLQMRIPTDVFAGSPYRSGTDEGTWPAEYSTDNAFPSRQPRLECNLADAGLNMVFECEDGIDISDYRQYGGPYFTISVSQPRSGASSTIDLLLALPETGVSCQPTAVRWSHIGYPAQGEKFVTLEWSDYEPRPEDWARLESDEGNVVLAGSFGATQSGGTVQGSFAEFDFSAVTTPGTYRVVWSGGATGWFPIARDVFTDALWTPTLDYFIPYNMCHMAVDLGQDADGHDECHRDDAVRAAPFFSGPDGFRSYECTGTPLAEGENASLTVGGWHDAGDHDLNTPAQSYVVWMLSLAYEEFDITRDVATLDADARTYVTGQPDGVPDILQQVEWGARWLLSVQQADGRVYNGVCANGPQRSGRPLGQLTDGALGTGDERVLYPDYHADQQLNYAIAMAAASRALSEASPALSGQCLQASRDAFSFFQTHTEVYRAGSYTDGTVDDRERDSSVLAAAAEMYLTTRETAFLDTIDGLRTAMPEIALDWPVARQTPTGGFRYAPPFMARLHPLLQDGALKDAVRAFCERGAQKLVEQTSLRPWPFPEYEYGQWGNTGYSLGHAFDTYYLTRVTPEPLAPTRPLRHMLWPFGLHPTCDTVLICGLDDDDPQFHYSTHLHALYGYDPASVPGAVIPGMGGFWYSGVVAYIDRMGFYGHNEACIYTSAIYIFAVNAMSRLTGADGIAP